MELDRELLILHIYKLENIVGIMHDSLSIQLNCLRELLKKIEDEKAKNKVSGIKLHNDIEEL